MKSAFVLTLTFVLSFSVNSLGLSETIFQDDFEDVELGESPPGWIGCPEEATIEKDPQDSKNKVMFLIGDGGATPDCAVIADTDELSEYVAEWDWLWEDGSHAHSVSIHWQKKGEYYHFSRRSDGRTWGIWARSGGSWPGPFVNGTYAWELNKWYRLQVYVNGTDIVGKIKEKDDDTPFDKIEPFMEMHGEDKRFDKGKFGPNEGWKAAYIDNVLLYIGEPSISVKRKGRLPTTWGEIRNY